MSSNEIISSLNHVLADTYALYLKTQNYHWNVTGPHFGDLHTKFEGQYADLADAVDTIAERIRALGDKVPATFKVFDKKCHIQDGNENAEANTMVKELASDNKAIVKVLKECASIAEKKGDIATADLMTQRVAIHDKASWMLSSYFA